VFIGSVLSWIKRIFKCCSKVSLLADLIPLGNTLDSLKFWPRSGTLLGGVLIYGPRQSNFKQKYPHDEAMFASGWRHRHEAEARQDAARLLKGK
jgi:hypothetical protein